MSLFFWRKPMKPDPRQQAPQYPYPNAPMGRLPIPDPKALTEDEVARLRLMVGAHVRLIESGALLTAEGAQQMGMSVLLLQTELLMRLTDEMRLLREDVRLLSSPKVEIPGFSARP